MVACLPVGRNAQTFGGSGGAVVAIASAGSTAGRQSEDIKVKFLLQAGEADGSSMAARETTGGQESRIVGGRDICVAVSGGLASVLELVQPLRHVGWAGRDTTPSTTFAAAAHGKRREVLRMARVPSTWRRAAAKIVDSKHAGNDHNAETVVDDVDGESEDFMVMCEDGWFGWYQCHHRRFEVSQIRSASRVTETL